MDRERGARARPFDAEDASRRCRNCGALLQGPFCSDCGQEVRNLDLSLRRFVGEILGSVLSFDSRAWRTLVPIVIRPGEVTARYLAGERARFVPPVRLYLFVSLVYFLALAWLGPGGADFVVQGGMGRDAQVEEGAGPEASGELARTPDGRFITPEGDTVTLSQLVLGEFEGEGAPGSLRALVAPLVRGWEEAQRDLPAFQRAVIQGISYLMFLLVPLFAALLHVAYLGRGYFVHHLLFALHFHAFSFMVLGVKMMFDIPGRAWLSAIGAILLWAPAVYLAVALQRVYGGAIWKNVVRAGVVGLTYVVALVTGLVSVVILMLL